MIPILMDSTKTLQTLATDQTNGLGALTETTACVVSEERNGAYTLELKIPLTAKHFDEISVGGIIKAKAGDSGDPQLFRIFKISKPMRGVVTISANHISYDLNKTSVLPFTATGITQTLTRLKQKMQGSEAFTFFSDINNGSSAFANRIPQSARALLGGQQGSLLDVFGGEYFFDNLTVNLLGSRGSDNGVQLRYGKNITDLQQEENIENTYTTIQPYALDSEENVVLGDLLTVVQTAEPKIMNLDLSSKFEGSDSAPTKAQINTYAQQYATANNVGVPKVSIKVSFVALWQTEEYKDIAPLERVSLCDTVTVDFEKLGVSAKAKVVSTKYDTLRERYTEIEIGDARSTLASTINGIREESSDAVVNAAGFLDNTIKQFTTLMANGLGLFVTREQVGETGGYKYYLHNRPKLSDSQYQWTFNSSGFAVSQDYGNTWSAGIDANGNAVFNTLAANVIRAMSISGTTINGGTINGAAMNLGGSDNASGTLTVKDASGNVIGTINNNGLDIRKGTINGPSMTLGGNGNASGALTVKDASGNTVGVINNSGLTMYKGSINGPSMTLGGANNASGTLTVKDASGNTVGTLNSDGLTITKGTISGTKINSGEMYWFPGTANEASIVGGTVTIHKGSSTWTENGIKLKEKAILIDTFVGEIIGGSGSNRPVILISPETITMRGSETAGAVVQTSMDDLLLACPDYGGTTPVGHNVCWRQIQTGIWALCAK